MNGHNSLLDAKNLALLRALEKNPRAPVSVLARRIKMSGPAVAERLQRLQEQGVIGGYHLEVSPQALGFGIMAFCRMRPLPGRLPKVAELVRASPEVTECHRVTGEDCFIFKMHLRDMAHLEQVLNRFLLHGQTTTSIVQSTPVPPRGLPLPERG